MVRSPGQSMNDISCVVKKWSLHRDLQKRNALRVHLTPGTMAIVKKIWTMNAGEDMAREELLFVADRNAKLSSHYGTQHGWAPKMETRMIIFPSYLG